MSIQFQCGGCEQNLKVPEGTAGKKVRCPSCEAVNVIPDQPSASQQEEASQSPFGHENSVQDVPTQVRDDSNPFAAPTSQLRENAFVGVAGDGVLKHQKIEFGELFEQTWRRFRPNLGSSVLMALAFGGLSIVSQLAAQGFQIGAAMLNTAIVLVLVGIIVFVLQQLVGAYQQCIAKRFGLNVGRGSSEPMTGIFSVDRTLRIVGLFLLLGLISIVVLAVVAIPAGVAYLIDPNGGGVVMGGVGLSVLLGVIAVVGGIVFGMRVFLSVFFIVDRNAGIVDSMKQSNEYMTGNSLIAFVVLLLTGIGAMLFTVFTCFIGGLFVLGFIETMQAVIYLKVTGQYQDVPQG